MSRNPTTIAADAETDRHAKPADGVQIRAGGRKWQIPTATIVSAIGGAALVAWGMIQSERSDLRSADRANAEAITIASAQIADCKAQLATEQALLAEIRSQLVQLNTRVAEIQVTLMRGGPR